jgi:hypothetical protein
MSPASRGVINRENTVRSGWRSTISSINGRTRAIQGVGHGPSAENRLFADAGISRDRRGAKAARRARWDRRGQERRRIAAAPAEAPDAYAGFTKLYQANRKPGPIVEAACWAHGRRKFFDLARLSKAPIATEAVKRIDVLFAIEREINGLMPQERLRVRQERSRSLIIELQTCSSIGVRFAIANYRCHGDAKHRSAWPYKLYDSREDSKSSGPLRAGFEPPSCTDRRQVETGSGQTVRTLNDLIGWLG